MSGGEGEEWPKKYEEKEVKAKKRKVEDSVQARESENKCVFLYVCTLKLSASSFCKEIHRMSLNL